MKQKGLCFPSTLEILKKVLKDDTLDWLNIVFLTSEESKDGFQYIIIKNYPKIGKNTIYKSYEDWVDKNITKDLKLIQTETEGYTKILYSEILDIIRYKPDTGIITSNIITNEVLNTKYKPKPIDDKNSYNN